MRAPCLALGAREAEGDVLGDGQMREQRALLRDVADRALVGRDVAPARGGHHASADRRSFPVGRDEPDDQAQQRRLAAAGGAEDRRQRSLRDDEVDVGEDGSVP